MMKKQILTSLMLVAALTAMAQSSLTRLMKDNNILQHLDASVTLGTTGVGLDVASPIGDYVQLRAGYAFMPRIHYHMNFDVQVGDNKEAKYDSKGNRVETKFDKMAAMLNEITGYEVDDKIVMIGQPTYNNFKLMVDIFPFKANKHWHFTAGFYWGSSQIAKAYNKTEDMPTLMAVSIYNNMYEKALAKEPFVHVNMNGNVYSFTDDPEMQDILHDKFQNYGRMGMHVGNFKSDGTPYMMEPGADGMVKAKVKVNSFKPYLGFGYGGRLLRGNDRYKVSFDCGAMFWGGTPRIETHDGTDLANDVTNISGKVGDYVDLLKGFKVFPVLNVRFTKVIF